MVAAQLLIVYTLFHQPAKQRLFCGISHVVRRRSIQRKGVVEVLHVGGWGLDITSSIYHHTSDITYRHAVLRERSGLIGTDNRYSPHCLRGLQLAHEVVTLQHTTHIQRQRQCHRHRQSLGYRHHDERNGHHEVFQRHLQHAEVVGALP